MKIEDAREFFARVEHERVERIANGWGDSGGKWVFHPENLTLELVHRHYWYEVDLERCGTSAAMLDWVFQVHGRFGKGTTESLLDALRDLLHPQGELCSWGIERGPIDIPLVIAKRTEVA